MRLATWQVTVQNYGCSSDCAERIVLKEKWRNQTIAAGDDCSVKFAHAAWKGSVVSVFVDGSWCGKIRVAYDPATEDWLRRAATEFPTRHRKRPRQ